MCYLAFKSGFVMVAARKRMNDDIYNHLNPNATIPSTPIAQSPTATKTVQLSPPQSPVPSTPISPTSDEPAFRLDGDPNTMTSADIELPALNDALKSTSASISDPEEGDGNGTNTPSTTNKRESLKGKRMARLSSVSHTFSSAITSDIIQKERDNKWKKWLKPQRICIALIAITFWIIGIYIAASVTNHYAEAEPQCNDPTDMEIYEHPSLLLYPDCDYKVYPMGADWPCQCRRADLMVDLDAVYDFIDVNKTTVPCFSEDDPDRQLLLEFMAEIIESVLSDWTMLEVVQFLVGSGCQRPVFHWNDDRYFQQKSLRTIKFDQNVILADIGAGIGNLKDLDVLIIENGADIITLPDEFGKLTNLRLLQMKELLDLRILPDTLCKFTELKGLQLRQEFSYVPSCLKDLRKLETLEIDFWTQQTFIPELLSLPELQEIALGYSNFTAAGFLGLQSRNDPAYNTMELEFNREKGTKYFLTYSRICNDYFHPTSNTTDILPDSILKFINETNACDTVKLIHT